MPYPMFKSTASSKPLISRPLPLRTYQDQEGECSRWSMSVASEDSDDENPRPSFWPARLQSIPPRSPLRSRLNRPNIPPALTPNFNTTKAEPDLGYYFDEGFHTPTTATTTTSSSSSVRCLTTTGPSASPASAPACHTTFASADPSFNQWLAATIGHQRHLNSRRVASATSSATRFTERDHPAPPVPPKDHAYQAPHQSKAPRHARSESSYDYTDYLEQTSSPAPPPSSLSLCNSSGWSCVARRTARTP